MRAPHADVILTERDMWMNEHSIETSAAPEEIWELWADVAGWPAWNGDIERIELDGYHYLHATRAELLRRLDRVGEAREAYGRALELVHSDAERSFLERRRSELRR